MEVFSIIVLSILGLGLFVGLLGKIRERKQYKQFLDVFEGQPINLPTLEFGRIYGWPTFEVTFQNKTDYEFARQNGLFKAYNDRIQNFYNGGFLADLAVTYTHLNKN
jgi:hypothetical protein